MISINIIGAGAVGQTLGHLWVKHQVATIQGVLNQSEVSSQRAISFIGAGQAYPSVAALPPAQLILLTVPDQQIMPVARQLLDQAFLQPGTIIMHCSGALSSTCLAALHARDCVVASVHPALSIKDPNLSITRFVGTLCALEGDALALTLLTTLFSDIGAVVYPISAEHKALYHVAAVFAANYPVTLLQQAYTSFLAAGLSEPHAKKVVDSLWCGVVENVSQMKEPKDALTGPIQRGDLTTIHRHLEVLDSEQARNLYRVLAQATLDMTMLNVETKQQIEALLLGI